ncbi:MAG: peptide deformylase [Pseudomonadota bacterium]
MGKILKVARMGHPILTQRAKEVDDPTSLHIKGVVDDMLATMENLGNNIGLAAPQVHIPLRILLFKIPRKTNNPRYHLTPEHDPDGVPLTILINPKLTLIGDETIETWESCLSVPGLMAKVSRHQSVHYSGTTPEGKQIERTAHGFHARAMQHEYDHLEGILFPMRMTDPSQFGFQDEILKHAVGQ